jgi:hypothetical protein
VSQKVKVLKMKVKVTEHVESEDLYEKEFDDMEGLEEVYVYMEIETENMQVESVDEYMRVENYKRVEDYYICDDLVDDYEMEWVAVGVDKEVHRRDYTWHEEEAEEEVEEAEEEVEVPRKKDYYMMKK